MEKEYNCGCIYSYSFGFFGCNKHSSYIKLTIDLLDKKIKIIK